MRRLPDYMVRVEQFDAEHLAVAAHEHLGAVYWTEFALADVPEDLTREEDLIGFVLNAIDMRSVLQFEKDRPVEGVQSAVDAPS